ncbi:MAG: ribosomal protein L13e [Candidatus Bathyarchaeia archaeon]
MPIKPKVFKKNGRQRHGKGFSKEELKRAGLSFTEALKLGIPIDYRRKTAHEENINVIKSFLEGKDQPKGKDKR